jgi:hypothetical protein
MINKCWPGLNNNFIIVFGVIFNYQVTCFDVFAARSGLDNPNVSGIGCCHSFGGKLKKKEVKQKLQYIQAKRT